MRFIFRKRVYLQKLFSIQRKICSASLLKHIQYFGATKNSPFDRNMSFLIPILTQEWRLTGDQCLELVHGPTILSNATTICIECPLTYVSWGRVEQHAFSIALNLCWQQLPVKLFFVIRCEQGHVMDESVAVNGFHCLHENVLKNSWKEPLFSRVALILSLPGMLCMVAADLAQALIFKRSLSHVLCILVRHHELFQHQLNDRGDLT